MDKKLMFILSFLFVICAASFIAAATLNSSTAFMLCLGALTFFVAIFAVGVLDYRVGGTQITLDKRVGTLEHENTELKELVTALGKCFYALSDGASRLGGPSEQHFKLVSEYMKPISHLLTADVRKQVQTDISKFSQ
jgi:ribosomal protein S13